MTTKPKAMDEIAVAKLLAKHALTQDAVVATTPQKDSGVRNRKSEFSVITAEGSVMWVTVQTLQEG